MGALPWEDHWLEAMASRLNRAEDADGAASVLRELKKSVSAGKG